MTLFGVTVPEQSPVGVFPADPDYAFRRGRKWETKVHRFSPVIEQRYVMADVPEITFEISLSAMRGGFSEAGTRFKAVWEFFNAHMGRYIPFYFYDPVPWAAASYTPINYRGDPTTRLGSTTPAPTVGRYIVYFDEDSLTVDQFDVKLRRGSLKLVGRPG